MTWDWLKSMLEEGEILFQSLYIFYVMMQNKFSGNGLAYSIWMKVQVNITSM